MKDSLSQFRLRKTAIELQSFTVTDLTSATGLSRESIQVFLHRLEKKGSLPITKENLAIREPGRPIVRYTLTPEGIDILQRENAPVARELNDSGLGEIPTTTRSDERPVQAERPWTRRAGEVARDGDLGNRSAVATLGQLFRSTEEPCPLILLGAGASFRSGVPTAADAVKQIARLVFSERELKNSRPPERVKPSEWESWLQRFDWFIPGPDRLAENFPVVVENLLVPAEFRKRVLLNLMRPANGISAGYKILADFVMRGLTQTVFTTNFDTCLPDALRERQPHIRHIHEVNRGPGDYDQFNVYSKCQIIWLHGRAEQYSDKNSAGETNSLDKGLTSRVRPMLDASPMIVIGYRGSEPSVMEGLFGQNKEGRLDFPNGVYWCTRHGESLHPNVEAFARRLGSNFRLLKIDGFDELFAELQKELEGHDRYAAAGAGGSTRHDVQVFDERVTAEATLEDLDLDLALSILREYCQKLGRAPLTREILLALMREQGLIVPDSNGDKVTAGALLLFGKRTQDFFPHAVVSLTEGGKKRQIYEGNLITQHRALLQKLESTDVNPLLKVKMRRQHTDQTAYPPRALVELLVNMLVHRDYEVPEPSSIELHAGSEIVFSNPGALTQKVAGKVTVENDGRIILSEGVTDQRNPSLCDIFFGISAMERAGTGLIDVGKLMVAGGGGSAFYHNAADARFKAIITQPMASAGSPGVARSDVPTGLYVLNVLPFSVIPESVSIVRLTVPWRDRPHTIDLRDLGTFVDRGAELWSFVPLPVLTALLEPIVDKQNSVTLSRKDVESSPDSKRVLSWLLRKHFEYELLTFEERDGLILEYGRKHRAYFAGKNRGERTIVWNSAQRRGNRREVVKRRSDPPRTWFENEGFGYEIVDMGGMWCVRIKPFYMFTGPDSFTPLPAFTRAAKATRRIKFDRNKSVEADLTFWANFLGRGTETMNVGDLHVDDLLIDMTFLTVEVPEIGLNNEPEHTNRMSA
jgi:DNA-binding PadR family transcriptional regulator